MQGPWGVCRRCRLFSGGESAGDVYRLRTGREPALYVQPDIALIKAAQKVNYTVKPGALGSALRAGGVTVQVLGNSDWKDDANWAALVAMDEWGGRVWAGQTREGGAVVPDPPLPPLV